MKKAAQKAHPYHYSLDKNILQKLLDWGIPITLFYLYFEYYNFTKITPSEMVKTSGLMAISLLSLTLIVGPLARFLGFLDILKAHRQFWGISSFVFFLIHFLLVIYFYLHLNLLPIFDPNNPRFLGLFVGLLSGLILFLVTLTSHHIFIKNLNPKTWKLIQTTSYIALILAVGHFFLSEQVNGVLVIKRDWGKITYYFALATILIRLLVTILPGKRPR